MTVEAWTQTPPYTVSGIGPYAINHPYIEGAILAAVIVGTARVMLNSTEFSVTPLSSTTLGNLFLSPGAAATHAGRSLVIDRATPDEQGYLAVLGEREAALMAQLDRMVSSIQEIRTEMKGSLRVREVLAPFDWADGTVPLRSGTRVISGPTAAAIAAAQTEAAAAAASAAAAAASAATALAKENSMLRARGAWVTGIFYSPSDQFTFNGSVYITETPHFATTVAADLTANRIRLWVAKGDAGPGSGDMLKTENLSGLASTPIARTNLGLGGLAVKNAVAFADIDPLALISDSEGLAANKVNNAVPAAKTVSDYVDGLMIGVGQTWQNMIGSRVRGTVYQNTTGRPIMVSASTDGGSTSSTFEVSADNVTFIVVSDAFTTIGTHNIVVPSGHFYRAWGSDSLRVWAELR